MKHEIEPWPRTCAMLRVHYHINAVKRCYERTRTARRRALCGRRRLRHAAAILLRQAGYIAPASYRRSHTNVTDLRRSFRRATTNQPPLSTALAELSCILLRLFASFLIRRFCRRLHAQSTSSQLVSQIFQDASFNTAINHTRSVLPFFVFSLFDSCLFYIVCTIQYAIAHNALLIIAIDIVSDRV